MKAHVMIAVLIGFVVTIPAGHILLTDLAEFVGSAVFGGILGGVGAYLGVGGLQIYKKVIGEPPDDSN